MFDSTTGAVISADITAAGFLRSVGPLRNFVAISESLGVTEVFSGASNDSLTFDFSTPTAASVVGYTGGSLQEGYLADFGFRGGGTTGWILVSGSLTEVVSTPEPSSALLLASALAWTCGLFRKRSLLKLIS